MLMRIGMSVSYLFSLRLFSVCVSVCCMNYWANAIVFECVCACCTSRYLHFPQHRHRINFSFRAQKPYHRSTFTRLKLHIWRIETRKAAYAPTLAFPLNDCERVQVNRISLRLPLFVQMQPLLFVWMNMYIFVCWMNCRRILAICVWLCDVRCLCAGALFLLEPKISSHIFFVFSSV